MRVVWPMGASSVKEGKLSLLWDDPDYVAEEKIDGERVLIHIASDGVKLSTRSGSVTNERAPIDITHRWPQIQVIRDCGLPVGTVLDSEVASDILRPEEVAGVLNYKSDAVTPDDVLRCFVFDCIYWGDDTLEGAVWTERYSAARCAVDTINNKLVSMPLKTFDCKKDFYDDIVASGGEGVVLKNIFSRYVQGKKPANMWVKAKKSDTFDCIITGFKPAKQGKYSGLIGSVELSQYKPMGPEGDLIEYRLFTVCHASGMTDDMRRHMTEFPEQYIGRVAVIEAAERLPNSLSLRHPRIKYIRPEGSKAPEDCIVE